MKEWQAIALFAVAGPLIAASPFVLGLTLAAFRDPTALGFGAVFAATALAIGVVPAALAGAIFVSAPVLRYLTRMAQHPIPVAAFGMASGCIACIPVQLIATALPHSNGAPSVARIATVMFLVPGTLSGGCCALLWRHLARDPSLPLPPHKLLSLVLGSALLVTLGVWWFASFSAYAKNAT